jgi:putative SOS response-associated peptidase YedK
MASIHDRMPAILPPDQLAAWLDPATPRDALQALLVPLGGESLEAYPVSRRVNVPGETGPECIERLPGT